MFRLTRQERGVWVTWPARVAALLAAEVEKQSDKPVKIEAAILQRVLETHVREQLAALADLRVSLGFDGAEDILRIWRRGMRPDPDLTVSEWADQHRSLSSRASAEPGR